MSTCDTPRPTLPPPLCSLHQVKLYKSDNLDNPINSISLGQSLFFHFAPLDRNGEVAAPSSSLHSPEPSLGQRKRISAKTTKCVQQWRRV